MLSAAVRHIRFRGGGRLLGAFVARRVHVTVASPHMFAARTLGPAAIRDPAVREPRAAG